MDLHALLAPIWGAVDGNWVDVCSFVVGVGWAVARCEKRRGQAAANAATPKPPWKKAFFCKAAAVDLASGTGLFPLFLLSFAVMSTPLLKVLFESNRLILTLAGIFALFGTLEDF